MRQAVRFSWTHICNIDNSDLWSEQVHLERLLPVGDQLKGVSENNIALAEYLSRSLFTYSRVMAHQREVIGVNPDDAEVR